MTPEDFYKAMVEGQCKRPRVWVSSPQAPNYQTKKIEIEAGTCLKMMVDLVALKSFAMKLLNPFLRGVEVVVTIACACGNETQIKLD